MGPGRPGGPMGPGRPGGPRGPGASGGPRSAGSAGSARGAPNSTSPFHCFHPMLFLFPPVFVKCGRPREHEGSAQVDHDTA
eukprot:gene15501-biopygen3686